MNKRSLINIVLFSIFLTVAIIQIIASLNLWIDLAYRLSAFMNYIFIAILTIGLISYISKSWVKFRQFMNDLCGIFIIPFMLMSFLSILGVNDVFKYYYSASNETIYVKNDMGFNARDKPRAKIIAEKLKKGDASDEILKDLYQKLYFKKEKK